MVYGVVVHSYLESELTSINPPLLSGDDNLSHYFVYSSIFFNSEGNNHSRYQREQLIASEVAKQFSFKCLCANYSQVRFYY